MSKHTTETAPVAALVKSASPRRGFLKILYPRAQAPIAVTRRVQVGRDPGPKGLEVDDGRMSRAHFELRPVEEYGVLRVQDLGSKNGTFVDGVRVERDFARVGAIIRAGDTLMSYEECPPLARMELDCGADEALAKAYAYALVAQVAPAEIPVLITGPTGSGKELLARHLHATSGREGRFVALNCGALPRELLGSELFGHKRGAFSGAATAREGLILSANGGTLFLDEIAELPLEQQPALLRVLQDRRVRPLGSDEDVEVDVRLVAATHQNLAALEASKDFRGDLLARLEGIKVALPGLAERRGDILPLFRLFLEDAHPLPADTAEALLRYDWPKNVRELEHLARRLRLLLEPGDPIVLELLPREIQSAVTVEDKSAGGFDRSEAEALLRTHRGNVSKVAKAAGQSRQAMYRRLRAMGLEPEDYR